MKKNWLIVLLGFVLLSCMNKNNDATTNKSTFTGQDGEIKLIIMAPGHFHASLLQKNSISQVNDKVFVYASKEDTGLRQYLSAIESFNQREEDPTNWQTTVYTGDDFLNKMKSDNKGNLIVLAGNNKDKTGFIFSAVDAGLNVLSDKPMAINHTDFNLLKEAYDRAKTQNVLLYDMMTERYDMLNIIERELINNSDFFGELQQGTPDEPAVYMESVHHFYKEVSGSPLIRPAWYYDVEQQGEGIADVTTHLIDQLFWKCFPEQPIYYSKDISNISSTHWATELTLSQFIRSTGEKNFPKYLMKDVENNLLKVYANGTIKFKIRECNIGMKVLWNYQAPEGGGDTFASVIKGTNAILETTQNKEQGFIKQLYVVKPETANRSDFLDKLEDAISKIQKDYPFVSLNTTADKNRFIVEIPVEHRESHESHFKYVAETFFKYLPDNNYLPEWEISNTLAKYFITTTAVFVAKEKE